MSNIYIIMTPKKIFCTKTEDQIQSLISKDSINTLIDLYINSYKIPESIEFVIITNELSEPHKNTAPITAPIDSNNNENINNKLLILTDNNNCSKDIVEIKFKNIENISSSLKNIQDTSCTNFKNLLTISDNKVLDLDIYFIGVAVNIVLFYMLRNSFYRQYISDITSTIPQLFCDEKIPIISCLCYETFSYLKNKLIYTDNLNENILEYNNKVGNILFKLTRAFWGDYKSLFPKNISDIYNNINLNISPPILLGITSSNINNIDMFLNKKQKNIEKKYMENFLKLNDIAITYIKMLDDNIENLNKLINGSDNKIKEITGSFRQEMQKYSDHMTRTSDIMTKNIINAGEQQRNLYENDIKELSSKQRSNFKQKISNITKNIISENISKYEETLKFQLENIIESHKNDGIKVFNELHLKNYNTLLTQIKDITVNIAKLNERYEKAHNKIQTLADLLEAQYNIIETKWVQIEEYQNMITEQKEILDQQNKSINEQRRIMAQQENTIRKNKKIIDLITSNIQGIGNNGKLTNLPSRERVNTQNLELKINKLQDNLINTDDNMNNFKLDTENKLNLMSSSIENILSTLST